MYLTNARYEVKNNAQLLMCYNIFTSEPIYEATFSGMR